MTTKMKRWSVIGIPVLALMVIAGFWVVYKDSGHKRDGVEAAKTLYTCGMHPQVIQDHPGNCPICGMKLTKIKRSTDNISIDPVTIQNMGIRVGIISNGPLRRVIRTVGTLDYNESAMVDVTTKFKGWIEKLYVDATGMLVRKGDPLFEIYSPVLYSAQTEYLIALNGGTTPAERGGTN